MKASAEESYQEGELTFFMQPISHKMTVYIDEDVPKPSYYRNVVQGINDLSENDLLVFKMASGGGDIEGLEVLLAAIENSPAQSIADITGICHSAASMLALHCDTIQVNTNSSMMVHYVSYGVSGHSMHVLTQMQHIEKRCGDLFRRTYKYFLTDTEIEDCINNAKEIWLCAEDIMQRLQRRAEALTDEFESSDEDKDGF